MSNEQFSDRDLLALSEAAFDCEIYDCAYLYILDLDFNPEAQLLAIRMLLKRNDEADQRLREKIRELEKKAETLRGAWADQVVERSVELMVDSAYQDATHSMAAVGMLAPFIESVLTQCFFGVRAKFFEAKNVGSLHDRWQLADQERWDCHFVYARRGREKDIVKGAMQLAEASGLARHLPADFEKTLAALFAYRNKMFHNGLEWPKAERDKFQKRINDGHWPADWFSKATSADQPWVFYMSQAFILHCLATADRLLESFGLLVKELWEKSSEPARGNVTK